MEKPPDGRRGGRCGDARSAAADDFRIGGPVASALSFYLPPTRRWSTTRATLRPQKIRDFSFHPLSDYHLNHGIEHQAAAIIAPIRRVFNGALVLRDSTRIALAARGIVDVQADWRNPPYSRKSRLYISRTGGLQIGRQAATTLQT
jgi:hypothetical protein